MQIKHIKTLCMSAYNYYCLKLASFPVHKQGHPPVCLTVEGLDVLQCIVLQHVIIITRRMQCIGAR